MKRIEALDEPLLNIKTQNLKQSNLRKSDNNFGLSSENRSLESLCSIFIRKQLSNKGLQKGAINLYSAAYNLEASKMVSSNIRVW
ncbi:15642_t:CDS:2, partial [Dentiscutata erythropus]